MEKKFEINLLVVGLFLLLVFALGFMAKRELVNRKEIRALSTQIAGEQRVINKMVDTINLKSDTIKALKAIVSSNNIKVRRLQNEVVALDAQLAGFELTLPPNEVYNELQNMRPDTLKKEWPFSTPQINGIYEDEFTLSTRTQEVAKYESITGMLTYNIQLLSKTDSLKTDQLRLCLNTTDEYKKMMDLKDKQIKEWQKRGRGRMVWGLTSTGVAAGLFVLLLL